MLKKVNTFLTLILILATFVYLPSRSIAGNEDIMTREYKTVDLISNIEAYNINNERLRKDSAIAHYNMGNIYFQKGEYEIAAREYYQAVTLMPDDPDAHFNLAFVSGEHLRDFQTAFKHYKRYLYLNPDAKDRSFVNEKIMHAKLEIRGKIGMKIEEDIEANAR